MADTIRWGILATGKIARSFARDLALVPDAEIAAVGSRRIDAARAFSEEHTRGTATAHGSYEELVADPAVDVVYIATPHALHLDNARLAFEAGKHVLCEKPLTLTTADAEELFALAREHGRFAMEAMWMACHPVIRALAERVRAGDFGSPRSLRAELGFRVDAPPEDRMFDPALGGGALLDMGIYPLTFAHLMLGEAEQLTAQADLTATGIDLDVAIAGRYPGGAVAALTASMTSWSSRSAAIATDRGRVEVPFGFHHPRYATFTEHSAQGPAHPQRIEGLEPVIGKGYGNEIAHVGDCLRQGLLESPFVPHAQTLTLMRQLDGLREQVGIRYAADA
ncbi:Gfo/Idh/MocA family protein [Nocardioides lianchengensis]|uniref:Predicted dehydrogenase n=1 Tax=Nocardioides lianchengensis TaxID=1045774 RepID=A0A1G6I122_9ACTN|nr:Gfo/Idh/MocA family oxidoreductase [Nocardioides lianchengensis]NYG13211.1 putative dehydrogenase [Nocardioides lianchengensis]SDC00083.1 Predicted dehydrogenase [Nocardioides lianchengensis]